MNKGIKIIFIYSPFLNQPSITHCVVGPIKQLLYSVQLPWQEFPVSFIFFHFILNGMFCPNSNLKFADFLHCFTLSVFTCFSTRFSLVPSSLSNFVINTICFPEKSLTKVKLIFITITGGNYEPIRIFKTVFFFFFFLFCFCFLFFVFFLHVWVIPFS